MLEVNGAYKLGRYEKCLLQTLQLMSVEVFVTLDGWSAGHTDRRTNTADYFGPYKYGSNISPLKLLHVKKHIDAC